MLEETIPPEIIILAPSSGVISRIFASFSFTNNKKPDVGFGVVGTKTHTYPSGSILAGAPERSAVINPMAYNPLRGYSIKQTSLKARSFCFATVFIICLREL